MAVDLSRVRAAVAQRHAALPLTEWGVPGRSGNEPEAWEYARVSNPDRFVSVLERGRLWAEELAAVRGIEATRLLSSALNDGPWRFARGTGLAPAGGRLERLRILQAPGERRTSLRRLEELGEGLHHPRSHPWLRLAIEEPDGSGGTRRRAVDVPRCGCDGCDRGSDALLALVDEEICAVVSAWSVPR